MGGLFGEYSSQAELVDRSIEISIGMVGEDRGHVIRRRGAVNGGGY